MKYLLLNHKMNLLGSNLKEYLENIPKEENIIIFPTSIYIPYFLTEGLVVGSQDVSDKEMGSVTSEVSAKQLKSVGVNYTLIGHSERRCNYKEENERISLKLKNCQTEQITAVLCIGEENKENKFSQLEKQLLSAFQEMEDFTNIWIAYEPLSAIGTGKAITKEEINETIVWIKKWVIERYKKTSIVLYGGSVNHENIEELSKSQADGFLIGNASLDPEKIKRIVSVINR